MSNWSQDSRLSRQSGGSNASFKSFNSVAIPKKTPNNVSAVKKSSVYFNSKAKEEKFWKFNPSDAVAAKVNLDNKPAPKYSRNNSGF